MTEDIFISDRKNGLRPGVVACIINKKQKILICLSAKHQIWEMPQGEIREGEDLRAALKREIGEELGEIFAQSIFIPEAPLITTNQIVFPQETVQGKVVLVGDKEVSMVGKKYYFCLAVQAEDMEPEKIEYSDFQWASFDEGMETIKQISQKGKKRILGEALEILKKSELIK